MQEAMREIARAVQLDPSRADLHAAIGNGLVRLTRYAEAIEAYRVALACRPDWADVHLALADLLYIAHSGDWREHLAAALDRRRWYPDPAASDGRVPVAMLLRDAPYSVNTPLEMIADTKALSLDKWFIEETSSDARVADDVILFCAFPFSRVGSRAIERATVLIDAEKRPVINHPSRLERVARERLAETLRGIDGLRVPHVRIASGDDILIDRDTLVRPIDTHAGAGLALVRNAAELQAHLQRHPADAYHVTGFVDYVSTDAYYRKYRMLFIDGAPYPYHLGISPRWMVHYRNAPMTEHAWMREEEAAFLNDPAGAFAAWETVIPKIAEAIGLEYVGIDCTQMPDGSVLIFEADPSMLIHDEDDDGLFAYKRPAIARIRNALTAMLCARAYATS